MVVSQVAGSGLEITRRKQSFASTVERKIRGQVTTRMKVGS